MIRFCLYLLSLLVLSLPVQAKSSAKPAKELFGHVKRPAHLKADSFGTYNKGCLAGGAHLEADGSTWQAMRLKRNRQWGHPALIKYLKRLSVDASVYDGWRGLLVGDMSQPRGGPMLSGHASHQIGLDADIWLMEMPEKRLSKKRRETISAISMRKNNKEINLKRWTDKHARLIRRAASYDEVARIFVHPTIKKALCKFAGKDRKWLRKIRPWYGHHYHFHVRLKCQSPKGKCKNQAPPSPGDGCGKNLSWWLSDAPYRRKKPPKRKPKIKYKPKPPLTLAGLPAACKTVLYAK